MSKRSFVVAICATLVFAVVATQVPAKRHGHAVKMTYTSAPVFTSPGTVGSGIAYCPGRTAITGGGWDYQDGIATIEMGFLGNAYYVLVDNFNSSLSSSGNVQAACTGGTTRNRARPLSRAQIRSKLADLVAARTAAHETQK